MNFRWVTLYVGDLEKSLYFYHELLGLPIDRQFGDKPRFAFLGAPEAPKVELIWDPSQDLTGVGKGTSFGLAVPNLEEMMTLLREKADTLIQGPFSPNPRITFYFVNDPDGYRVQLIQE